MSRINAELDRLRKKYEKGGRYTTEDINLANALNYAKAVKKQKQ